MLNLVFAQKLIFIKFLQLFQVNRIRNQQKISVNGQNVPPPVESFEQLAEEYSVGEDIINNLTKNGYSVPTPIQMQALPIMLQVYYLHFVENNI